MLLQLQDEGYDRSRLCHGLGFSREFRYLRFVARVVYWNVFHNLGLRSERLASWIERGRVRDQTLVGARAQIACVLRRET